MKHLTNFRIFESKFFLIDEEKWEDVKDIIQLDILDTFNIPNRLVEESLPGKSGSKLLEPELHIRINDRFNNDEPQEIMKACRDLHKRVFAITGLFIDVRWSSQQINIMLNNYPNHYTIIRDFNLEEVEEDNIYNHMSGGLCDYDTAIKIMDYLNGFYRFVYDSDKLQFKKCYDILDERYNIRLVFSLPKFDLERFRQIVCFKFNIYSETSLPEYKPKFKINGPIFSIDTNHVDSPLIRHRVSNTSWNDLSGNKMFSFLNDL